MKKIQGIDLPIFDEILLSTQIEDREFVSRSLEIANQIIKVLDEKSLKQKDLADKMNKTEAEISKWLSGFHNFTLKSLVKIETALESRIITTPQETIRGIIGEIEDTIISFTNKEQTKKLVTTRNIARKSIVIEVEKGFDRQKSGYETVYYTPNNNNTGTYN